MKDIYSPLEIDEEWDDMAPMADGPNMTSGTAIAVKPEATAPIGENTAEAPVSTLPPVTDNSAMNSIEVPASANMPAADLKETSSEDAAYEVANANMDAAINKDDKLNIGDINPSAAASNEAPMAEMPAADASATAEQAAPTPIPVIDMNEASKELKDNSSSDTSAKIGESFTPQESPVGGERTDMASEEEAPKEEKEDINEKPKEEKPAASELPVSPGEEPNTELSKFGGSKNEMKFDMEENPMPEVSNTRLESLMSEWADMKKRTQDRLNDLRSEKDEQIRKLEEEIKAKEDAMAKAEAERDDIDAKLNELV